MNSEILETKINEGGGVVIEVTPTSSKSDKQTEFEVKFTTHQDSLDFDLIKQAVLIDDKNNQYFPAGWTGGQGGHHLTGTLLFPALPAETKKIKLVIKDIYGIAQRLFEWDLK